MRRFVRPGLLALLAVGLCLSTTVHGALVEGVSVHSRVVETDELGNVLQVFKQSQLSHATTAEVDVETEIEDEWGSTGEGAAASRANLLGDIGARAQVSAPGMDGWFAARSTASRTERYLVVGGELGESVEIELKVSLDGSLGAWENNSGPVYSQLSAELVVEAAGGTPVVHHAGSARIDSSDFSAELEETGFMVDMSGPDDPADPYGRSAVVDADVLLRFTGQVGQEYLINLTMDALAGGVLTEAWPETDFLNTGSFAFNAAYDPATGQQLNTALQYIPAGAGPDPDPVIPEPATLTLLGLGVAGLASRLRRRRG